jgi:membrane associated rhomboid family serine protease
MNHAIILANIAGFIWQLRDPSLLARHQLDGYSPSVIPFLTYAFLHINLLHLVSNLIPLLMLGPAVNEAFGHVGYLAFYLAGAAFAGIGFILSGGNAVVGASGAVGAVMGAFMVLHPRAVLTIFLLLFTIEVPSLYLVTLFFCYNVFMSFATAGAVRQVAYEAHAAGVAFGIIIPLLLLLGRLIPRLEMDLLAVLTQWRTRRPQPPRAF